MSDAEAEDVCPGCEAHNMAEDCYHSAQGWELAEAIRDGVERQHPGATWTPIEGAWGFADDAQDVLQDVGEGPWRIEFDHAGGQFASIGLVNRRYLIGIEDGDGEAPCVFIGDIQNLSVAHIAELETQLAEQDAALARELEQAARTEAWNRAHWESNRNAALQTQLAEANSRNATMALDLVETKAQLRLTSEDLVEANKVIDAILEVRQATNVSYQISILIENYQAEYRKKATS